GKDVAEPRRSERLAGRSVEAGAVLDAEDEDKSSPPRPSLRGRARIRLPSSPRGGDGVVRAPPRVSSRVRPRWHWRGRRDSREVYYTRWRCADARCCSGRRSAPPRAAPLGETRVG